MSPRWEIWPRYPFSRSLKWTFSSRPRVGLSALAMYCRRIAIGSAPMTSIEPRLRISGDRMSGSGPRARAYADPTDSPSWPRERLTALYRQSKVIGGLFRSLGQEGESVGSAITLLWR